MKNVNAIWKLLEGQLGINFERDAALLKSIRELSAAFTSERSSLPTDYFDTPRARKAYLAYFVPLNYLKIEALLRAHKTSLGSTWCDFGCGPGTATLAALSIAAMRQSKEKVIRIFLIDQSKEARTLATKLVKNFATDLGLNIEIEAHAEVPEGAEFDTFFAANVLNEMEQTQSLEELTKKVRGSSLFLEPSHRVSSQKLIRMRSRLLKSVQIVGPCTHCEECPLFRTKHWCHFSEPLTEPQMIELNLKAFNNPRGWLKFSYLLLSNESPRLWDGKTYRAIGDLHPSGMGTLAIDLCSPREKKVFKLSSRSPQSIKKPLVRGAKVVLRSDHNQDRLKTALPLTLNWISSETKRQKKPR